MDNFTLPRYLKRRIGSQFYLNTWHGDRALKKIAYDAFPERRLRIEETCDLVLAGSEFGNKLMRSAFRYEGERLAMGGPRNDVLVKNDPADRARIRASLGIPEGTRLLLYAPTFRDSTRLRAFECPIDLEAALDVFQEKTGEDWLCLYRAHYLALGRIGGLSGRRMQDMTKREDMADLLLIADALITDYSSSAMDIAILKRAVFLYHDDIEEYVARERRLYFLIEDSPFLVAKNQEELASLIRDTSPEDAERNCEAIMDYFGFIETGRAARCAAERIVSWMDAGRRKETT